jgi:hypothetical protein
VTYESLTEGTTRSPFGIGKCKLICENFLQYVGRFSTESTRNSAQQIKVYGYLCISVSGPRVHDVLRTAGKTLHGNEVFAPDYAKAHAHERKSEVASRGGKLRDTPRAADVRAPSAVRGRTACEARRIA